MRLAMNAITGQPETADSALVLADRLRDLAGAVTRLPESVSEFSMRVPAEPDRDADIVLMRASILLRELPELVARYEAELSDAAALREEVASLTAEINSMDSHA